VELEYHLIAAPSYHNIVIELKLVHVIINRYIPESMTEPSSLSRGPKILINEHAFELIRVTICEPFVLLLAATNNLAAYLQVLKRA